MDDFENIEQGEKSSIYENKRTYCGVEGTLQAVEFRVPRYALTSIFSLILFTRATDFADNKGLLII